MPRVNSSNWSVNDPITATRLQDFNDDLDDVYVYGSDRGRVRAAISGTALKIDVGACAYRVGNNMGTYAGGTDISVTNAATNYVEIDGSGIIQINTTGWTSAYARLATVVCAGGVVTTITLQKPDAVGGELGGSTSYVIAEKTSDYTLLAGDSGKLVTNRGATGRVVLTLPAYTQGYYITIANTAGKELVIRAASGEVIKNVSVSYRGWKSYGTNAQMYVYAGYTDQWLIGWIRGGWAPVNSETPAGTSNGFMCGGDTGAVSAVISKLTYSGETEANIGATLDTARQSLCGVSGTLKGYLAGGSTGSLSAVISALVFSGETEANLAATLNTARSDMGGEGCVYGEVKGYIMGGTSSWKADIDDIDFSDDSSDKISTQLSTARGSWLGAGSSSENGYEFGGQTGAGAQSDSVGMIFIKEAMYAVSARLSTVKQLGSAGVQNFDVACYLGGYYTFNTEIEKFHVPTESMQVLSATLDTGRYRAAGMTKDVTKGFWGGGRSTGFTYDSTISAMTFSGDTEANIAATLDTARSDLAGLSNNF